MALTNTLPARPLEDSETVGPSIRAPAWQSAAVVGGYLLLGVVAYWPALPGISSKSFSTDADFVQSMWFLGWVPHALVHGLNPFFSNSIFAPTGVNLAQNTSSPLLGLVTAPFAMVLSPLTVANLLIVVGMPISATAAFVVFRKWHVWLPAAALGGLVYGFSPYMVGQSVGHLELTFLPLPPFIALTVASILQCRGSSSRLGLVLGLLVTAQYLISPEVLAIVALLTGIAIAAVAIRQRSAFVDAARGAARPVAVAFGLTAVLLVYPVWMLLAGPQHFLGTAWPLSNPFHNDLLSFVARGPLQRVSLGVPSDWGGPLAKSLTEAGGYIGVPMLILAAYLAWRSRRIPRTQLASVLFVCSAILSLGPYLSVDGTTTRIPLPFLLLDHIPFLENILPSRISFAVDACLAALVAFGLDDMRRQGWYYRGDGSLRNDRTDWRKATTVAGLVLGTLVVTQLPEWPYAVQAEGGLPAEIERAIPPDDPIAITYPVNQFPDIRPTAWQAESGFSFRMIGGYAYHPSTIPLVHNQWRLNTPTPVGGGTLSANPMDPPGLQTFLLHQEDSPSPSSSTIGRELVATTRKALFDYDIRMVVVDRSVRGSGQVVELFTDTLGPPTLSSGPYSLWADRRGPLGGEKAP